MRILIYPTLIISYLISRFVDSAAVSYLVGILSLLAIVISFKYAKGLYLYSGLFFGLAGMVLFFIQKKPFGSILFQFDSMLGIMSLFVVLPFLNSIIRAGRYDMSLSLFLRRGAAHLDTLYKRSFFISHTLGLFLNIATIPLLKSALDKTLTSLSAELKNKFLSQSLLRGYAFCLMWSPLEILVLTSLDITGASYLFVLMPSAILILLFMGIDGAISRHKYGDISLYNAPLQNNRDAAGLNRRLKRKLFEMLFMLLILVILTTFFQRIFNQGFLVSVVFMIMPVSFIWALFIKKPKRYIVTAVPHWKERTKGLGNYFFMFLCAGLFVRMLDSSGALRFLENLFQIHADKTLAVFSCIGLFFLITSLIGFHPLVSISMLSEMIPPVINVNSPIPLTVVLIFCSLSTVMYSPFNLSASILSDLLRVNPYKICKWNVLFAIGIMAVSILFAFFLHICF